MVCLDSKNNVIFYCFLIEDYKTECRKKMIDFWKLRSLQKLKKISTPLKNAVNWYCDILFLSGRPSEVERGLCEP